jgi:hypothetical protein
LDWFDLLLLCVVLLKHRVLCFAILLYIFCSCICLTCAIPIGWCTNKNYYYYYYYYYYYSLSKKTRQGHHTWLNRGAKNLKQFSLIICPRNNKSCKIEPNHVFKCIMGCLVAVIATAVQLGNILFCLAVRNNK